MKKKIAIVHDFTVRYGGAEALVKSWMDEYPEASLFTLFYDEKKMGKFFSKERVKTSYLQKWYTLTKRYTWMLPFMPKAIESFDLSEYDIILSSSAAFSHGLKVSDNQKHICYVHSPMRWAWDWHFEFIKERKMGSFTRFIFQWMIHKIRIWDEKVANRPTTLLAASTEIQKRIEKYWRRDSQVVFPFADTDRFIMSNLKKDVSSSLHAKENLWGAQIKAANKNGYFLVVSQLVPYKKIEIAIQVCEELGLSLKIVGGGVQEEYLKTFAGENTEFLGSKYGYELVAIMQGARAFLFPGVDDFGITPVEAMACGVPVVAYKKAGALDTVKPNVSGVFFEEQSVESLKDILKRTDFDIFDPQKIREVAEQFSKEKHIQAIKKLID